MMGYTTPNIDRIADEGVVFTDYYAQQSCTAGRACFITGQNPIRTGLTKVGMPGADGRPAEGRPDHRRTAQAARGYATGQFGKNHLGDRDEFLPTVHGFDEFFGNLYHLNAEEEPETSRLSEGPRVQEEVRPARRAAKQTIENTGPLTKKRMETIDEEFLGAPRTSSRRQQGRGGRGSAISTPPGCTSSPT
jgi:arylsulfatase A-like enzyme